MIITIENVLFRTENVALAYVNDKSIILYFPAGNTFTMNFESKEEALTQFKRLNNFMVKEREQETNTIG